MRKEDHPRPDEMKHRRLPHFNDAHEALAGDERMDLALRLCTGA
jgi:hypothetical protein